MRTAAAVLAACMAATVVVAAAHETPLSAPGFDEAVRALRAAEKLYAEAYPGHGILRSTAAERYIGNRPHPDLDDSWRAERVMEAVWRLWAAISRTVGDGK